MDKKCSAEFRIQVYKPEFWKPPFFSVPATSQILLQFSLGGAGHSFEGYLLKTQDSFIFSQLSSCLILQEFGQPSPSWLEGPRHSVFFLATWDMLGWTWKGEGRDERFNNMWPSFAKPQEQGFLVWEAEPCYSVFSWKNITRPSFLSYSQTF
jgi:hypothetical protein